MMAHGASGGLLMMTNALPLPDRLPAAFVYISPRTTTCPLSSLACSSAVNVGASTGGAAGGAGAGGAGGGVVGGGDAAAGAAGGKGAGAGACPVARGAASRRTPQKRDARSTGRLVARPPAPPPP